MNLPWSLELPEGPGETIPSRGRTWTPRKRFRAKRSSSPVRLDLLIWFEVPLYYLEPTSRKPSDLTADSHVTRSLLQSKVILKIAGDGSAGATPVPIPNTAVKPCSADGTPFERTRE